MAIEEWDKPVQLPACLAFPDGHLTPGSTVAIEAVCLSAESGRFRVDLFASDCQHVPRPGNAPYDASRRRIALHFNARFGEGPGGSSYVLMNSYDQSAGWQADERSEQFPFVAGKPFRLEFVVESSHFVVAVDGKPQYRFENGRYSLADMTRLHIEGPNLQVNRVQFNRGEPAIAGRESRAVGLVAEAPPVPFFRYDPGLGQPCDIHLAGSIAEPFERYFVINLARTGGDADAKKTDIPLHVSVRSTQAKVIRNTLKAGAWGQEESCLDGPFLLSPGTAFEMVLQNRADAVTVLVNGQNWFRYRHRHDPGLIDTLEITGSVALTSLRYEFIA